MAEKKQSTELAVMQPLITAQQGLQAIAQLQGFVKDMLKVGQDYGEIPGTKKNTLLKPGAEKLNKIYGFAPRDISILTSKEDWREDEASLFDYTIKTILVDREDRIVGIGLGSCNSYESKYRYRNAARVCPDCNVDALCRSKYEDKSTGDKGWYCYDKKGGCGAKFHSQAPEIINQEVGKVENPDIADVKNTVLKMAKKRSLIDATINATMSSDLFTQDVEDFKSFGVVVDAEDAEVIEEKKPSTTNTSSTKQTSPSTSSSTAKTSTQSATTGQKPPATTADKTPGQTGNATQANEKKPSAATGTSTSSAGSSTTSNATASNVANGMIGKDPLELRSKREYEKALHDLISVATQAREDGAEMPPQETAPLLLAVFNVVYSSEHGRNKLNTIMGGKHGITASNKAEKYTWDVFDDVVSTIQDEVGGQ